MIRIGTAAGASPSVSNRALPAALHDGSGHCVHCHNCHPNHFYEVPALLALRLEQSASSQWNHTPEWEAVQKFLSKGEARTAGVVTLHSVSRKRPRFEDGEVFFVTAGYLRDPSDPSAEPLPLLEERFSGTRIEIEPVLREDE